MRIGIDFDNTIVCYDRLFHRIAVEKSWLDPSIAPTKQAVRDTLRKQGQEEDWIWLQGEVYGARILQATPFPGVLDFLAQAADCRWPVNIISHKTKYPFKGEKHDLHQAARRWLSANGLEPGGLIDRVDLELTKQEKLQRIGQSGCDLFIDDLPEFLSEPDFPCGVHRLLFDPDRQHDGSPLDRITHWDHASTLVQSLGGRLAAEGKR